MVSFVIVLIKLFICQSIGQSVDLTEKYYFVKVDSCYLPIKIEDHFDEVHDGTKIGDKRDYKLTKFQGTVEGFLRIPNALFCIGFNSSIDISKNKDFISVADGLHSLSIRQLDASRCIEFTYSAEKLNSSPYCVQRNQNDEYVMQKPCATIILVADCPDYYSCSGETISPQCIGSSGVIPTSSAVTTEELTAHSTTDPNQVATTKLTEELTTHSITDLNQVVTTKLTEELTTHSTTDLNQVATTKLTEVLTTHSITDLNQVVTTKLTEELTTHSITDLNQVVTTKLTEELTTHSTTDLNQVVTTNLNVEQNLNTTFDPIPTIPEVQAGMVRAGELSSSSTWGLCPMKCERSKTQRILKCKNFKIINQSTWKSENCFTDKTETKDCLELEECNGTRLYLAVEGLSCKEFCNNKGMHCSPEIDLGGSSNGFNNLVLQFEVNRTNAKWSESYEPYCKHSMCFGYKDIPEKVECEAKADDYHKRRVCHCQTEDDIGFGPWSPWSQCSATCEGHQKRDRTCLLKCFGSNVDIKICGKTMCPIHGEFSSWTPWSECSTTCGGGERKRTRSCDNPEPSNGGNQCVGKSAEVLECSPQFCPQDASPGDWTNWSACNKPCNGGNYVRTRECKRGLYGGREYCNESLIEEKPCFNATCPDTFAVMTLKFNLPFIPDYSNKQANNWQLFKNYLKQQIVECFELKFPNIVVGFVLSELREGSVIADFTIYFENFDSFQFLYLQDSIEIEKSISKLQVIDKLSNYYIAPAVPNAPPANIMVTALPGSSLNVTWSDVPLEQQRGTIIGYILFYRQKLNPSASYSVLASDGYELILTGLKPGILYALRLLAYTKQGNGVASSEILQYTSEMIPSTEPKHLLASTLGSFGMYLEWKGVSLEDMNGIPLGYKIFYDQDNRRIAQNVSFTLNAIVIEDLIPDTHYMFEVCAYNKIGHGPCQRANNKTLPSAPSSPPKNVTISETKTHDSLTLVWSSPAEESLHGDLIAYNITYQSLHSSDAFSNLQVLYETTHPSVTTLTIRGLKANTKYVFAVAAVNIHGVGVPASITEKTCNCPESVSSAYYILPPYIYSGDENNNALLGVYANIIDGMVEFACGTCQRPSGVLHTTLDKRKDGRNGNSRKKSLKSVVSNIDTHTDLVFPVVSFASTQQYLGYPFVKVINHPGIILITKDESINDIVMNMIRSMTRIIPLLGLNVLMMILAGFLVWILEGNQKALKNSDFSIKLWKGMSDGWYWAFVTQGTQGYGDFSPVSLPARLFAVVWILIGLIMSSIIVGFIASVFTTINESAGVTIYGSKIGAISESLEQSFGVLRNGKMNTEREYVSVDQLSKDLLDGKIEGVLLDAYTAGASKEAFNHPQLRPTNVFTYAKAYGLVLSGDLKYIGDEIRDYIKVNEGYILEIANNNTNKMEPREKEPFKSIFDASSDVLVTALLALVGIYAFFFIIGVLFHFIRRAKQKSKIGKVLTSIEKRYEKLITMADLLLEFGISKKNQIQALEKKFHIQSVLLYKDKGKSSLDAPVPVRKKRKIKVSQNQSEPPTVESHQGENRLDKPQKALSRSVSVNMSDGELPHDDERSTVMIDNDNVETNYTAVVAFQGPSDDE